MKYFLTAVCCWTALFLAACNEKTFKTEIHSLHKVPPEERIFPLALSTRERLGLGDSAQHHPMMMQSEEPEGESEHQLKWEAPVSWEKRPAQAMRLVTYAPKGSVSSECSIFILSGPAGGLEANINRWRSQVAQPPLSDEEIAALPRLALLNNEAVLVEMSGVLTNGKGEKVPSMIYGLVCPYEESTLFIKMTGPVDEMQNEKENFHSFAASLYSDKDETE